MRLFATASSTEHNARQPTPRARIDIDPSAGDAVEANGDGARDGASHADEGIGVTGERSHHGALHAAVDEDDPASQGAEIR